MTNIDHRHHGNVDDGPPFGPPPEDDYVPESPDHHAQNGNGTRPESRPEFRPVPHDDEAERYVLGAALLDPHQLTECTRLLTPRDFWQPAHETIWRALLHQHANDLPLEPQAVVAHLIDTREITSIGGADYLFGLIQACSTPASAPWYARRVESLARRRETIGELRRGLQRLEAPGDDHDVDEVLNTVTTHLTEARDSLANPPATTTWSPVDLAPVLAGEYLDPPPTMLHRTDGVALLYDGAVHVIAGESESGKTWLALIAALELLQNDEPVVFVDFEDRADRVVGRLLGLGATFDQIAANFSYIRPDRPLDDDGRAQLAPHLTGARLVILDGVTEAMTLHGYDLNSNADTALYLALLPRWIADHGPAVVMIDHLPKDKEKHDRHAIGAQHKLAGIDGVQYLVKMIQPFARGRRGLARVDIGKDRPGHVRQQAHGRTIAEFTLDASGDELVLIAHLMPVVHQADGDAGTFEPTHLMEKISRYVQANPGMSKKAIESAMNGKTDTKRLALELLVTRGYIGVKTGPRGRIQHHHVRAYYDGPDPTQDDPESDPENDPDEPPLDPDFEPEPEDR